MIHGEVAGARARAGARIEPRSYASDTDDLVNTLKNDSSDKNRLSAALNLARLGDGSPSVLLALAKALINDSDKNVRGGVRGRARQARDCQHEVARSRAWSSTI